jgi:SAM-dependent methyltransferase
MDMISSYYQADDYISHTDTGKGWVNRLYHLVRKKTLSDKSRLLSAYTGQKNGKLLDLGAGTGAFAGYMQSKGWQVTGLEPDEGARRRAKIAHSVDLLAADHLYGIDNYSCDAVTLWHVLEHVHALHNDVGHLKRIIRPSGKIFIAVPNYTSHDAFFYKGDWAAYDVPRHLYHFSPLSMKVLLKKHQLHLIAIRRMWYDSIYISLLSERYKRGRPNMIGGLYTGLVSNLVASFKKERCSSLIYIIGK